MVRDEDIVPTRLLPLAQDLAARLAVEPIPRPPSVFPPASTAWYTYGGCFSLAIAVHDATGWPIELYRRGGRATHAYAVDGDDAVDARGRTPLEFARRGAQTVEQAESEASLRVILLSETPEALELIDFQDVRVASRQAAAVLLRAIGRL